MNRQIRILTAVLLLCFTLLFVQVNLVQVGDRSCAGVVGVFVGSTCRNNLSSDSLNTRGILRDFTRPRGAIATADGVVLAKSVDSNDKYVFQRVYPQGDLYGQITGYFSFVYGSSGLESQYTNELSGNTANQELRSLSDLFSNKDHSGNLTLTLRDDLQRTARSALGARQGSVVVLDPRDGNVLALWNNPSFDPNPLSHHDTDTNHTARDAKQRLDKAPGSPLLNQSIGQLYPPGSTFKLVTGSIGVDSGDVTPDHPSYPPATSYRAPVPYGKPISNFAGEVCGGTLFTILAQSCNSAFAQMGTETIGPKAMIAGSERFGFGATIPLDLPGPKAASVMRPSPGADDPSGTFTRNLPLLALASIGQGPTVASPLQMALVTAAIANKGVIMTPHLLDTVRDADGKVIDRYRSKAWKRAMKSSTATTMLEAMRQVVATGTATNMAVPGFDVGAKTGTAELEDKNENTVWMAAWGGKPGQSPSVVVVVMVPNLPGYGNGATGSVVAGPVAQTVLAKALGQ